MINKSVKLSPYGIANLFIISILIILYFGGDIINVGGETCSAFKLTKYINPITSIITSSTAGIEYKIGTIIFILSLIIIPFCLFFALFTFLTKCKRVRTFAIITLICYIIISLIVEFISAKVMYYGLSLGIFGGIFPIIISTIWLLISNKPVCIYTDNLENKNKPDSPTIEESVDDIVAEMEKINSLKNRGLIDEEEYKALKARILKL